MNAGLTAALRVREFRALWAAELLSVGGDQLARVALAVLVYGRTGSPAWAAATYALTFLPALLGGVLLSWPADRYRRREVMVGADLLRAALAALMAVPGLPLGSVVGAWLFLRFVPEETRIRLIGVLACAAGLPLILCALRPGLVLTLLLWALSGLASTGYLLQAQASFVRATPDPDRGRAIGFAASGLIAAQGVTIFLGGLLAERRDPATAVAAAGAIGAALALGGAVTWERATGGDRSRLITASSC